MGEAADDQNLLERYAASRDGAAFAEIVRRHVDLVHSAAVRRVGDRHMAEDVTQAVFVILARKPRSARSHRSLTAWFLTTVRYAAANALKVERRRRHHEQSAAVDAAARGGEGAADPADALAWQELAAHLDDAVLGLPAADRRAVLLRYFERLPIHAVAVALGVSEDAAKQRLRRAVEKLRVGLARRTGLAALAPAAAAARGPDLAVLLESNAVQGAPLTLAAAPAALAAGTGGGAAAAAIAKGAMSMMRFAKLKLVAAGGAVAVVVAAGAVLSIDAAFGQAERHRPAGVGRAATTTTTTARAVAPPREDRPPAAREVADDPKPAPPPPVDQAAAVEPHDLLHVTIPWLQSGAGRVARTKERVDADGRVTLPALRDPVAVKGKTLAEAKAAIDKAYADASLWEKPDVTVTRAETAAEPSVAPGRIAEGAHLEIRVWDLTGPNRETHEVLTVDDKGEVTAPLAGAVKVAGEDEAAAERAIAAAYERKGILADAWLTVRRISEDEARDLRKAGGDGL
jgi:RNA polymerase sigma factor (sigma-70 family)